MLERVAFPAEEGLCCINRISLRRVDLLTRVEPNTGFSSLCECKVGLGGEGLTNVDGRPERKRIGRVLHRASQLFGRPG